MATRQEYNFQYTPLEGRLPGSTFEQQTEDAINDIGNRVATAEYNSETAIENIETAMQTAQEAKNVADDAETTAENAQASADTANDAIAVINNTLTEIDWTQSFTDENGVLYQKLQGIDLGGVEEETLSETASRAGQTEIANAIRGLSLELLSNNVLPFSNVAKMKETDVPVGSMAVTKGYYAVNDGGAALYNIRAAVSGETYDNGSLILLDNGNVAELITDGTVNVAQFGAYGDGTHDDTTALQNCLNYAQGKDVIFNNGEYKISTYLTLGNSSVRLIGNGSKIFSDNKISLLIIEPTAKDILIQGIYFTAPSPTTEPATALVVAQKSSTTAGIDESSKDIVIDGCTFEGGTIELGLYSSTNAKVSNCTFLNTQNRTDENAGGYCILLQSAYNTIIKNNVFKEQKNVRHCVYVSVDPSKTANLESINTEITNNYFDDSEQERTATTTAPIMVRMSKDTRIIGNVFDYVTGVAINPENGDISCTIANNEFYNTVISDHSAEPRSCINLLGNLDGHKTYCNVYGNKEFSGDADGLYFISLGNTCVGTCVHNMTLLEKTIRLTGDVFVDDFSTARADAYRIEDTSFTGKIGNHVKCASHHVVTAAAGSLYIKQVPQEWLWYRYGLNGTTQEIWGVGDYYVDYTSATFGSTPNEVSIVFDIFRDSSCRITPSLQQGDYRLNLGTASNPLTLNMYAAAYGGGVYQTKLTAQAFYVSPP